MEKIKAAVSGEQGEIIWIHCSSLGEFEQGKPVIEGIRARSPMSQVLLTFFSPSGYEVRKDHAGVDYVFYLPFDSKKNARQFLDLVNPALIIFVKYDLWYYYLSEARKRNIHSILISAVFRKDQIFFRWYGTFQRKMIRFFDHVFVQAAESKKLLEQVGIDNCSISGDTRFDSVIQIAEKFEPIFLVEQFIGNSKSIIGGSTWRADEEMLRKVFSELLSPHVKLIIAPHEIHQQHLNRLKELFPDAILFSEIGTQPLPFTSNILIIDNVGMLSRLYKYAYITYVGGGFTRDGVHNVLEAAVYGKPVVFGKNYRKYKEAIDLVEYEGAKAFSSTEDLYQILKTLLSDEHDYKQKCEASRNYVLENRGATQKILRYIDRNRLLTS